MLAAPPPSREAGRVQCFRHACHAPRPPSLGGRQANSKEITDLEKYRGDAKPRFFFYRDGEVMEAVEGVNAPSISRCARRAVATADGGPLRALPSPAQVLRGVLPRGHGGGGGGGGGRGRRRGGRLSGAGLNLVVGWRMVLRRGRTLRALCVRTPHGCVRACATALASPQIGPRRVFGR